MKKLILFFLAVAFVAGRSNAAPPDPGPNAPCDQSSLAHATSPPTVSPPLVPGAPALQLSYHAIFPGGSLNCFIDRIHPTPQALQQGDGQVPGEIVAFPPGTQGIVISLTAPAIFPPIPGDPSGDTQTASAGLFSTDLHYGPGTFFSARATFIRPSGPFGGAAWAVTLNARTGGNEDLGSEKRLNVTLKFKKNAASLNVFENGNPRGNTPTPVPQPVYKAIVNTLQPFTLELMVSRITGRGAAILTTAGNPPVSLAFSLTDFGSTSGPVTTAVGPALATCCVPAAALSVELTDFQIFEHPSTLRPHG